MPLCADLRNTGYRGQRLCRRCRVLCLVFLVLCSVFMSSCPGSGAACPVLRVCAAADAVFSGHMACAVAKGRWWEQGSGGSEQEWEGWAPAFITLCPMNYIAMGLKEPGARGVLRGPPRFQRVLTPRTSLGPFPRHVVMGFIDPVSVTVSASLTHGNALFHN